VSFKENFIEIILTFVKEAIYILANFYIIYVLRKALLGLKWSKILLEKLTFVQLVKKLTCLLWNLKVHYILYSQEATTSKCYSHEVTTPASYLRGSGFKSHPRDWLS
jgi:hypothetical protein